MCGICGKISFRKNVNGSEIKTLMDSIKHRGPDGQGYYLDNNVALGHVRLSIIDVSKKASQPMISGDEEHVIIFNGEIYNYKEIKEKLSNKYEFKTSSDTEALMYSYIEWGESCLTKLNGMFSFVIYNKKKKEIFCARDRFGIKPFFYYYDNTKFIFGSEIKAVIADPGIEREINEKMLYDFLAFNRTDHDVETCFKGVKNLRPAHCITLNAKTGKIKVRQWYKLPNINENKASYDEVKKELYSKLLKSVELHMTSDVPVGISLSGGLDSSTIASLMRNICGDSVDIPSFSAVYGDDWEKDERKYVVEMCKYLSIKPEYARPTAKQLLEDFDKLVYCQEEPFISASLFAGWCVSKKANEKGVKVLMTGQGADEIFGYDYMAAFYFYELFKKRKWSLLIREMFLFLKKQKFSGLFTTKLFVFLLSPNFLRKILLYSASPIISREFFKNFNKTSNFYNKFFKVSSLNESVRNHLLYKLNHNLRVDDKNAMAWSVEGRVPFLEMELVEFCMNIPANMKVHDGEIKFVLKEVMKEYLPPKISNRNDKIGYDTPMDLWFREPKFVDYVDSMLSSEYQPMEKYLNIEYIKKKWNLHKTGKQNNGQIIWKYLFLTRWNKIFFDNSVNI